MACCWSAQQKLISSSQDSKQMEVQEGPRLWLASIPRGLQGRRQGKQLDNCPIGLFSGIVICHTCATQGRNSPQPCGHQI